MRHAHGGRGLVDVLSARAARAVVVDAHIVHVDRHLDRVVDLGHDIARRERRVSPCLRVKRRDAHETVNALLRFQKAVGVVPLDKERCGLDARLIARLQVGRLHGKAVPLRPASVHAEEHLRPVLRLRATRARMERQDGIVRIVVAREQHLELQSLKSLRDEIELGADVILHGRIPLLDAHLVERLGILVLCHEPLVGIDAALQRGEFLIQLLRRRRVVPKGRLAHLVLELGDLLLLRGDLE